MGFSLEPLCHTKRHNQYISTHPPTLNVRLTFCMTKWVWTLPLSSKLDMMLKCFRQFTNSENDVNFGLSIYLVLP